MIPGRFSPATRTLKWAGGTAALLGLIAAGWWLDSYRWAGGFRRVEAHFTGSCASVNGVPSPEDLQIDRATRVAYVSSYDRTAVRRGERVRGAILAYDLSRPGAPPLDVTPAAPPDFRPHGISLFVSPRGTRLFAINHAAAGERVEVFDLEAGRLVHASTISGAALVSPNDLVAVDRERFYATNSRGYTGGLGGWLEATLRLNWANVVYYDGIRFTEAIGGVGFPNGINADRDGRRVFLVSSFDQAVLVYSREPSTGRLTRVSSWRVGTRIDNVDVAEDGGLWVAGRVQYFEPPQPSQVVRITGEGRIEEIYVSTGAQFGNASVAAAQGRDLLIGSSSGSRFLHCVMGD